MLFFFNFFRDKVEKLIQNPERKLKPIFELYFIKNLCPIYNWPSQEFEVSYDEIRDSIKSKNAIKLDNKKRPKIKSESPISFMNQDFSEDLSLNKRISKSRDHSTILNKIDMDFKPKMLFSTKTYTRICVFKPESH